MAKTQVKCVKITENNKYDKFNSALKHTQEFEHRIDEQVSYALTKEVYHRWYVRRRRLIRLCLSA